MLMANFVKGVVRYEGVRRRTKVVLQQRMYRDEIPLWLEEADKEQPNDPSLPTTPQGPPVVNQQPAQGASGNITTPPFSTPSIPTPPSSTPVNHLTSQQTPPSCLGSFNQNGSVSSETIDTWCLAWLVLQRSWQIWGHSKHITIIEVPAVLSWTWWSESVR